MKPGIKVWNTVHKISGIIHHSNRHDKAKDVVLVHYPEHNLFAETHIKQLEKEPERAGTNGVNILNLFARKEEEGKR